MGVRPTTIRIVLVLALAVSGVISGSVTASAAPMPVRIMVVGDSITHGSVSDFTWRYRLAKSLTAGGVVYDLVGPRDDLFDTTTNAPGSHAYRDPAFDTAHDAFWGSTLSQHADTVRQNVLDQQPSVLLVHLGINDLAWGGDVSSAEASLRRVVAQARSGSPTVRLMFGEVLTNQTSLADSALAAKITGYNARLRAVAAEMSTAGSPIDVVASPGSWAPGTSTYDGTHPSAKGEFEIAKAYADALSARAGIGPGFGPLPTTFPRFPAPATLSAQPRSNGMLLQWDVVPGATGYYVYQRDVTANGVLGRLPFPVQGTSFEGGLLTNGHQYEWRVSSTRGNEEGGQSPPALATPVGQAPPAPTGLSAQPQDGGAVLTWNESSGAEDYFVYQRDVTGGGAFTRLPWPVQGGSWTAGLLANDHVWEFKLVARNANGESAFSNSAQATPRGALPNVPSNLVVAPGDGRASLSWTPSAGASGYFIWQRDVTAGQAFGRLPFPVSEASFTAGLLTNGHVWEFKVTATNSAGTSGYSNTVSVTPQAALPAAPTSLTASPGDASARLVWRPSAGATGYYIWQRDVTAGQAFGRLPYPVTTASFTAGLLQNGHVWEFKVAATNSSGLSGYSNTVQVKPTGPVPTAPTNLTARAGDAKVALDWAAVPGATGYYVYQRDVTAGQSFGRLPYPVSTSSFQAALLTNGHTWQFAVTAINANGESSTSNAVSAVPRGALPSVPQSVSATPGEGIATLRWTAVSGATGYVVYQRGVTAGEGFTRLPVAVAGTSWVAKLLINGHTYEYKLRAQNLNGESAYSLTVSVKPLAVVPGSVGSFKAVPANKAIVMSWAASPNATGYIMYARRHGSTQTLRVGYSAGLSGIYRTYGSSRWTVWVVPERNGTAGPPSLTRELFSFADDYDPGWSIWPLEQGRLWQNQCTGFAAWRVQINHPEAVGFWNDGPILPHAKYWASAAVSWETWARAGVTVNTTPRVGDVAQWTYEPYGHVAFVAAIDGSTIYLEEYNYTNDSAYDVRTVSTATNFIHFTRSS